MASSDLPTTGDASAPEEVTLPVGSVVPSCPKQPETVTEFDEEVGAVAVDESRVYLIKVLRDRGLFWLPKGGGALTKLVGMTSVDDREPLGMDATHLYFFEDESQGERLVSLAKAGGAVTRLTMSRGVYLALTSTHLYFTNRAPQGPPGPRTSSITPRWPPWCRAGRISRKAHRALRRFAKTWPCLRLVSNTALAQGCRGGESAGHGGGDSLDHRSRCGGRPLARARRGSLDAGGPWRWIRGG
jgi:hypothetical protein